MSSTSKDNSTVTLVSHAVSDEDERRPLLPIPDGAPPVTPLPTFQLTIVCIARISEPIAFSQIFSYVNQMVEELGIASRPEDVGLYSGLIDSAFSLAQMTTIYQWSRLSDRIGRKPVILIGMSGVTLASVIFGFSTTFWQMMIGRALAGALTGNVAIIQTVVADITDKTNESKAFPLPEVMWTLGCALGPPMGGVLAHAADRYPNSLGRIQLLRQWPFLLPCLATACFTGTAMLLTMLFLKESHPRIVAAKQEKKRVSESTLENAASGSSTSGACTPESTTVIRQPSTKDLLSNKNVFEIMLISLLLTVTWIAERTLVTIWMYTPIALGGLDRPPVEIGIALACSACVNVFLNLAAFPKLQQRFGTLNMFVWPASLWPVVFVIIPVISAITQSTMGGATNHEPLGKIWIGVALLLFCESCATLCYPASFLMVNAASPTPEAVGAMFGLSLTVCAIGETLGPALSSSLFAYPVDKQILGGNLVWIFMIALSVVAPIVGKRIRLEM